MSHRIFTTSEKAWAGMLAGIKSARKSIYMEMYRFETDTQGYDFVLELKKAAQKGIKVILILDILGSYGLSRETVAELRTAGVEVIFYSFFLRRTHRKILIIDEEKAYIGGVNIKKKYAAWRDLQIMVTGNVVRAILYSFARAYRNCGGTDKAILALSRRSIVYKAKLWFVERGIGKKEHILRTYYKERINHAKSSIILVTPYLLPPRWLIAHLHQAILRGVVVEILLPRSPDHPLANRLNKSYISFLSGLGARCYFSRGMNHAKAMLIDHREGVIGSQNLDHLSFSWNSEAGVFFHEPAMVRDLEGVIHEWKEKSVLFNPEHHKLSWYYIVDAFFLRLFGLLPLW